MKFINKNGKPLIIKNYKKKLIKWDDKSRSNFQFETKQFLKQFWKKHIVFEEFVIPKTRLSLDFFNFSENIAIEVQGPQHLKYNKFFHGNTNYKYLSQLKRDQEKLDFCEEYDIKLIEIYSKNELNLEFFKSLGVEL